MLIVPGTSSATTGCQSGGCTERVAAKRCTQARPVSCIHRAALHWRVSFRDMLRVGRCESGLNPLAVGFGVHRGMFQFNYPATWNTTPYRWRNPFSAKWNSLATGWMWSHGRKSEWQCK